MEIKEVRNKLKRKMVRCVIRFFLSLGLLLVLYFFGGNNFFESLLAFFGLYNAIFFVFFTYGYYGLDEENGWLLDED